MPNFICEMSDGNVVELDADCLKVDAGALVFFRAEAPPPAPLIPLLVMAPRIWKLVRQADTQLLAHQAPPAPEKPFKMPFA